MCCGLPALSPCFLPSQANWTFPDLYSTLPINPKPKDSYQNSDRPILSHPIHIPPADPPHHRSTNLPMISLSSQQPTKDVRSIIPQNSPKLCLPNRAHINVVNSNDVVSRQIWAVLENLYISNERGGFAVTETGFPYNELEPK